MTPPHPSTRVDAKRLHVLVSYAYWNSGPTLKAIYDMPSEWNVMLDSGAFTTFTQGRKATSPADYAAYCKEHESRWWRIINLDRIGDPVTSDKNLRYLHAAGVPALPVFQRGDNPNSLKGMAHLGSPVCVGGISQMVNSKVERQYLDTVMRIVKARGIKTHLLGVGGPNLFEHPCWSGDTSSWMGACRFGTTGLWSHGRMVRFNKHIPSSSAYIRPSLARTKVLASYGLTWEDVATGGSWSTSGNSKVYIASIRSWIRFARSLSMADKRYVFAAVPGHIKYLATAWNMEKHKWT